MLFLTHGVLHFGGVGKEVNSVAIRLTYFGGGEGNSTVQSCNLHIFGQWEREVNSVVMQATYIFCGDGKGSQQSSHATYIFWGDGKEKSTE